MKISCGIKDLDKILDGGFEENKIFLIIGPAGSGKSVFAFHFLKAGVEKADVEGNVGYVCVNKSVEDASNELLSIFPDIRDVVGKRIYFMEPTPYFSRISAGHNFEIVLQSFFDDLIGEIKEKKLSRVVVDPFSLLITTRLDRDPSSLFYNLFFSLQENTKCTFLFTINSSLDKKILQILEELSYGCLYLKFKEIDGNYIRQLVIKKMLGFVGEKISYNYTLSKEGVIFVSV